MRSERRLPPRRGGYPMLHPQPSSLFRDGWRDEAGENVALPLPSSPPPPPPRAPQAPSPPRATSTAHLGASAARPSRFLLSPLTSKSGPSAFPPCSPEPFPASSPLIGRDVPPSAPRNDTTRPSLPSDGCRPALCISTHPSGGAASKTPLLHRSPAPSAPSGPTCAGRRRLR